MIVPWMENLSSLRLKIWRVFRDAGVPSARPTSREEGVSLSVVKPSAAVCISHHLPYNVAHQFTPEGAKRYINEQLDQYALILSAAGIVTERAEIFGSPCLLAYMRDNR